MGDGEAERVAELERRLHALEQTAAQTAALREELGQVQRVQELEARLHELETRHAGETAALRREIDRARGRLPVRDEPPARRAEPEPLSPATLPVPSPALPSLGRLVLRYQIPTLILGVCLLPMPLFVIMFAPPVAVVMLLAAVVSYTIERRREPGAPPGRLRHQVVPFLLLQPVLLLYAYIGATMSFRGASSLRVDDFLVSVAIMEAGYLAAVALPLALVTRRFAAIAETRVRAPPESPH